MAELTIGDEFQNNGPSRETGQHFFNALFANELAEVDQQGGLASPAVIKKGQAEEVLLSRRFAPARSYANTFELNSRAKEVHAVQIFNLIAGLGLRAKLQAK